jgi:hypothetical protein
MARAGTPIRETLVIGLMPLLGLFLAGIAAREADGTDYGWAAFVVAFTAGIFGPLVATVVLARRDRLFLRGEAEVERNRGRIFRFGTRAGYVLGATLVLALAIGGLALVVGLAFGGGALLGFWPGLLANYLRLRREKWSPGA